MSTSSWAHTMAEPKRADGAPAGLVSRHLRVIGSYRWPSTNRRAPSRPPQMKNSVPVQTDKASCRASGGSVFGIGRHASRKTQVDEQPSASRVSPSSQTSPPNTSPSPQIDVQRLGVEAAQRKPSSIAHVALHPSAGWVLPSSQVSPATMRASPQIDRQLPGPSPRQTKPVRGSQLEVHPIDHEGPSSQPSFPRTRASPQVGVQRDGSPVHVHPGSCAHARSQPSPAIRFPSSQASAPCLVPSPQEAGSGVSPRGAAHWVSANARARNGTYLLWIPMTRLRRIPKT